MKAKEIHSWQVTTTEARDIQFRIRDLVVKETGSLAPHFVTGADISFRRDGAARSAAVTLSFPSLEVVESVVIEGYARFPYVPGLLTFREAPLLLSAFERMKITPDLILVDGQGIAHPRRFGVASHLGVLLDIPTIGCAKSRLCGEHDDLALDAPAHTLLRDGAEIIGAAVRTRTGSRPLYVSIGHRVDLPTAIDLVLACCRRYRLPEPTRLAHLAAGGHLLAASASPG